MEKDGKVVVFGAAYSVYVRAVRLALTEKSVPYELVEIDVFAPGGPPADYLVRQPFGRIPAFPHSSRTVSGFTKQPPSSVMSMKPSAGRPCNLRPLGRAPG
jgi:hypothetical protein